jgi:hypothetical protein
MADTPVITRETGDRVRVAQGLNRVFGAVRLEEVVRLVVEDDVEVPIGETGMEQVEQRRPAFLGELWLPVRATAGNRYGPERSVRRHGDRPGHAARAGPTDRGVARRSHRIAVPDRAEPVERFGLRELARGHLPRHRRRRLHLVVLDDDAGEVGECIFRGQVELAEPAEAERREQVAQGVGAARGGSLVRKGVEAGRHVLGPVHQGDRFARKQLREPVGHARRGGHSGSRYVARSQGVTSPGFALPASSA